MKKGPGFLMMMLIQFLDCYTMWMWVMLLPFKGTCSLGLQGSSVLHS